MGQYKKHLYGATLYGELNVVYGQYITGVQDAQEKFNGKINHTITAVLPFAVYEPDTYETTLTGSWTINSSKQASTNSSSASFKFEASGSYFEVFYRTQQGGPQTLHLELQKKDGTVVSEVDINTYALSSPSTKSYKFPVAAYDMYSAYVVQGTIPSGAGYGFTLDSFKVSASNIDVEIRASSDKSEWTDWLPVSSTLTQVGTSTTWTIKGTSSITYSNIRYIQARLTLVTSDENALPVVQRIELQSGSSNLRTQNGLWSGVFNMTKVAAVRSNQLGSTVSFKRAKNIRWTETVPSRTSLTIRSSSSYTGESGTFGAITAPYRKDTKRLRLKQGSTQHSVRIGPINPVKTSSKTDPRRFMKVSDWIEWNDISYLPKDGTGIIMDYIFSKTATDVENDANILQRVSLPMRVKEDGKGNQLAFKPQPFYLTVKMEIEDGKGTPVVDLIDLYCKIDYSEPITISTKTVSAVDNKMTGRTRLQKIGDTTFHPPSTTGESDFNKETISEAPLTYTLTDKTGRPKDVQLFYLAKENATKKPRVTESPEEQVYAKVFNTVRKNYKYDGGTVQYLKPRTEVLDSTFTPSLTPSLKYKYYVMGGWSTDTHVVQKGESLDDIADVNETTVAAISAEMARKKVKIQYDSKGALVSGQTIYIPAKAGNPEVSLLFSNGTVYSTKSSHNSRLDGNDDVDSDDIIVSVPTNPNHTYTEWTSEEKIFNGVINYNDIRSTYFRRSYNTSAVSGFERTHKALETDTWATIADKYDVQVEDLMIRNEGVTLAKGRSIIIPPNILLPRIAQGVEFESSNPYEITIVDNSVYKTDGTPLDTSVIPIDWTAKTPPLVPVYKTAAKSPSVTISVTRGVANDKDALQHHDVISITSVKKKNGMKFNKWNDTTQTGDYKLDGDFIDWSPAEDLSAEPAPGEVYYVTYTYREIDYLDVTLNTSYIEETGVDLVWRSTTTIVKDGICSPGHDSLVEAPAMEEFSGYGEKGLKDYDYVIEDNDLWVETSITEVNDKKYILGTLKNRNPKDNWFPLITPGFYYLKEEEFYMYSEMMETPLEEKEIPIAKNVGYEQTEKDMGIRLEPKRQNLLTNSTFTIKSWKTAGTFNFKSIDVSAPLDPTNFVSTAQTYNSISLSWTKSITADVVRYEISIWDEEAEDWRVLTSKVTGNTYTAIKLDDNTLYTFKVAAIDEAANASEGIMLVENTTMAPDRIPPYNVTTLISSGEMSTSLVLSWTASESGDAVAYYVYNGSKLIGTPTTTTFFVENLTTKTTYKFTVKAKDKAGNLSSGTSITVTTP